MIVKTYAVYCDICEKPLGCYYNYKPTPTKLRADGIKSIRICVSAYPTDYYGMGVSQSIVYSGFGDHESVNESDCFATKEELIASL